jgi:lipopolysaccharide export system ATP-binding protein
VILRGESLSHSYGEREVLSGVSIGALAGEIVGLIGPNGAGKSTCFRLLSGLLEARAGRVLFGDRDVTRLPLEARARLGLGYLPQEPSVFRGLSVTANVEVALEAAGVPKSERADRARAILDDFGLLPLARERGDRLSGGERRKVEIARLWGTSPRVLVLDEPFTGLDPLASAGLRGVLRKLAGRGLAVLLTDHHVAEALPACDRAVLLVEGRIVVEGPAEDIAADQRAREAYLGG